MMRVLPVLLVLAAVIFTEVHVVQSNSERIRVLPKALWFGIVLVTPVVGMVAYWIFGRPLRVPPPPPVAPDDDPEFLRSLR